MQGQNLSGTGSLPSLSPSTLSSLSLPVHRSPDLFSNRRESQVKLKAIGTTRSKRPRLPLKITLFLRYLLPRENADPFLGLSRICVVRGTRANPSASNFADYFSNLSRWGTKPLNASHNLAIFHLGALLDPYLRPLICPIISRYFNWTEIR